MKTYEEAIKEMAGTYTWMRKPENREFVDRWTEGALDGNVEMVAFIYGKSMEEVRRDIKAAA